MTSLRSFAAAMGLALVASTAAAQDYPTKTIRWIVPYTPGGITDNVSRLVATRLEKSLGQTIVIDNKPGANSQIGVGMAARAAPDGYTVVSVIPAHTANATLYEGTIPYDAIKSFAPISLAGIAPLMLTVNNDLPVKTVGELIAYAKANPGKLSFGSSGNGSAAHLTSELLKQVAGIDMVHVPYKGTAPALTDLLSGSIQVLIDTPSSLIQHVRAGKMRALGMFAKGRVAGADEVPTLAESGGPEIESATWVAFLAPAKTPEAIVNKLSQAVAEAVKSPELSGQLKDLGIIPVGNTPAEAGKFLADEVEKWGKVIRTGGIKVN